MNHVYSIGHSLHAFETFRALLDAHGIEVLVDVRSRPMSTRAPQFNAEPLRRACLDCGLRYLPMGDVLGGRTDDPSLLVDGRVDYERVAGTEHFSKGLERVRAGAERFRIALMCAEKDPLQCHRMLLVARALAPLLAPEAEVRHILADGSTMTQEQAEDALRRKFGLANGPDLFRAEAEVLARAYALQAREVAWAVREGADTEEHGGRP